MKFINPCKKCLVQPACTSQCKDQYLYKVTINQLLFIPQLIYRTFRTMFDDIKYVYTIEEGLLVKSLIVVLILVQFIGIISAIVVLYLLILKVKGW